MLTISATNMAMPKTMDDTMMILRLSLVSPFVRLKQPDTNKLNDKSSHSYPGCNLKFVKMFVKMEK